MIAESGKEKTRRLVTQLGGSKGRGFLHLLDKLDLSRRVTGWRWATSGLSAFACQAQEKGRGIAAPALLSLTSVSARAARSAGTPGHPDTRNQLAS